MSDLAYRPEPGRHDEAFTDDGSPRPAWIPLARGLAASGVGVLAERQRQADRLLDAEGAGHLVHDMALDSERAVWNPDSRPWRLDPIPLVIAGDEFARLSRGVAQRVRLIDAVLADAYGPRSMITRGIVSGAVLHGSSSYRLGAHGVLPPGGRHLVAYAVDLVRLADGTWRVVRDQTDAPVGLGYTMLDRSVMARLFPDVFRQYAVASIGSHAAAVRNALADVAPSDRSSPRSVVFTGGLAHASYIEHSYLAVQLGFHLAEAADLVVRGGRVWLRALGGLEPVDVVLRRVEDPLIDPLEMPTAVGSGVPALALAARRGGVALANAYGASLAEDPALRSHFADLSRELLGEDLLIPHFDPAGCSGAASGPATSCLATTPVYRGHGVEPGACSLRLHAVVSDDGVHVLPGGSAIVLDPSDHPDRPTARVVKDVWVVGRPADERRGATVVADPASASGPTAGSRRAAIPQVDFATSLPTRAADALYCMGRAAERAEVAARTARVVGDRLDQDPGLPVLGDGSWAAGALALLRSAQARPFAFEDVAGVPMGERLRAELVATAQTTAAQLGSLIQEAVTVREYLSVTAGRVLGRLARTRSDLVGDHVAVDDLDLVLVDLAALSGLATESTVRGPAWRFLDLGRRLERAVAVVGAVEAAFGLAVDRLCLQPLAEVALAANESLVAYRRIHRSDVELDALLDLVVRDDTNPRSLSFQLDRLREHAAALAWPAGVDVVERASRALLIDEVGPAAGGRRLGVDQLAIDVRGPLLDLGAAVVERWFADPVDPHMMGEGSRPW